MEGGGRGCRGGERMKEKRGGERGRGGGGGGWRGGEKMRTN